MKMAMKVAFTIVKHADKRETGALDNKKTLDQKLPDFYFESFFWTIFSFRPAYFEFEYSSGKFPPVLLPFSWTVCYYANWN